MPGDLVDCGCFNGGSSVMMATGAPSRDVWAFDSFEGLPPAGGRSGAGARLGRRARRVRGCGRRSSASRRPLAFTSSRSTRCRRFALVSAGRRPPRGRRSAIREATLETFEPKVSPGGYVVIDDYGAWEGREATDEYRAAHGLDAPLAEIDHTAAAGASRWRLMALTARRPLHRADLGWRSTVAGAMGLRPAIAQVSADEGRLPSAAPPAPARSSRSASPRAAGSAPPPR